MIGGFGTMELILILPVLLIFCAFIVIFIGIVYLLSKAISNNKNL